ncbi:MAG: AMP-binding protein, partial [Rhodoblastus sp.]|nr:AMP-binding protein [Rhodoblastus sp.]
MQANLIERAPDAYPYPLLIKSLLTASLATAPDQEIVYRELRRHSYRDFYERVCRLAGALEALGVKPGDTVAMMDWDSHRYLECFFAVPMMGAVLQTVNVRLNPEQILYTFNHARPKIALVNSEFFDLLATIRDRLETVEAFVSISDEAAPPQPPVAMSGEYEALLAAAKPAYDFPDFDE